MEMSDWLHIGFYPPGKRPIAQCIGGLVDPGAEVEDLKRTFLAMSGIEPRFFSCTSSSLVAISTTSSRLAGY